jgi:flagellar hook-associated protein 1 FlgK
MNDFISSQKSFHHYQRGRWSIRSNTLSGGIADYNKKIVEMEATGGNSSVCCAISAMSW